MEYGHAKIQGNEKGSEGQILKYTEYTKPEYPQPLTFSARRRAKNLIVEQAHLGLSQRESFILF